MGDEAYGRNTGYYVLLDLMRADLGTTAQDQADACFGAIQVGEASFTPYPCDGVLMSGFLGSDAVKPFVDYCRAGKNVFIISRSSNKSAREVQDLLSGDRVVYQVMADLAMRWSTGLFGANGYSEIGIAVGATEFIRKKLVELSRSGIAVLLVSADLNEVMELSDSLIVMQGGHIAAYFEDTKALTDDQMGEYMLGLKQQSADQIRRVCHD